MLMVECRNEALCGARGVLRAYVCGLLSDARAIRAIVVLPMPQRQLSAEPSQAIFVARSEGGPWLMPLMLPACCTPVLLRSIRTKVERRFVLSSSRQDGAVLLAAGSTPAQMHHRAGGIPSSHGSLPGPASPYQYFPCCTSTPTSTKVPPGRPSWYFSC